MIAILRTSYLFHFSVESELKVTETLNVFIKGVRVHLTLKMTSTQVVETSVTKNSSFQNYAHPENHTIRTTDTPGFKYSLP